MRGVHDLSATPFFLRGSGYPEGTLFPWVVSDFSLIDAIESGLVKIPRVPVSDDLMSGDSPAYREIWSDIRDQLPKRGRGAAAGADGPPQLPLRLDGALRSLYDDYARSFARWQSGDASWGATPPVFIVVCNNTAVSKLVYDAVAGHERTLPDGTTAPQASDFPLFSNVHGDGRWDRPAHHLPR